MNLEVCFNVMSAITVRIQTRYLFFLNLDRSMTEASCSLHFQDESRYEEHRHWLQSPAVADRKAASRKGGNSRKLM